MIAKISGTYTLANGDRILITGYSEDDYETDLYNNQHFSGQTRYIDHIELSKTNGSTVDITDLVIDLQIDEYLLNKCN